MLQMREFFNSCFLRVGLFTALALMVSVTKKSFSQVVPSVDHHQHLRDSTYKTPGAHGTIDAHELIDLLDAVGTKRAVVLSTAYGPPPGPAESEYERVKYENDWTAIQVRTYPDRLTGFCGINPMKDYAVAEIDRCSSIPELKTGIKMHFGNSDTDLDDPAKLARLQAVFAAADARHMAIAIHMRPSLSHQRPYGRREARVFLNEVLPKAPHVIVQIAHLAGPGGFDPQSDQALQVFIAAIKRHDARMKLVYFDVSGVAGVADWREHKDVIAARIRQIGTAKILWGSDGAFGGGITPTEALTAFRQLPLTERESREILQNVAPYLR
jgi:predicted TIM-barrel fold metal-dependent hydrolase